MAYSGSYTTLQLLHSVRKSLLGEVIPSLRGVSVKWGRGCIILYFYHDGPTTDGVKEHYAMIGSEVISDYANVEIEENIISAPYPSELPKGAYWAYLRKEPFVDP